MTLESAIPAVKLIAFFTIYKIAKQHIGGVVRVSTIVRILQGDPFITRVDEAGAALWRSALEDVMGGFVERTPLAGSDIAA
jgi:hypothetical protein